MVSLAALVLVASAGVGGYLGFSRASAAPGGSGDAYDTTATPTVAAKTASAIPDSAPPPPVPDETFIRKIAREEIQAAIHPKRAAPVADGSDSSDNDSDTDQATPPGGLVTPTPPSPATSPPG